MRARAGKGFGCGGSGGEISGTPFDLLLLVAPSYKLEGFLLITNIFHDSVDLI